MNCLLLWINLNLCILYYLKTQMGLWPWMMNQIFTKKFWRSIKRDGFLLTHTRGHKAQMHAHSVGGYGDNAKFVGRDEFGNKYYEDFDAYHWSQRRWVEYADYLRTIGQLGDRVPPAWHGWLAGTYDDVPIYGNQEFVNPYFKKPHMWSPSLSLNRIHLPKSVPIKTECIDFKISRRNRYAQEWDGQTIGVRGLPEQSTSANSNTL